MPITEVKRKPTETDLAAIAKRTPEQQALIDKWRADKPLKVAPSEDGLTSPVSDDHTLWTAELAETCGTSSAAFLGMILDHAGTTACGVQQASAINMALAAIRDIAPSGPLEAMLASQMVATHRVAMDQLRRAAIPEQTAEGMNMAISRANKLMGTFTKQVEALSALRGKTTQQKVTVKHVHVHEGGQAVVGNVYPGDGGRSRKSGKPHASPVAYAPESEVWSEGEDAERAPLSLASDGQR